MRGATRNKQPFWYALYDKKTPCTDEYGNETGWNLTYGNPVKAYGNISPAKGEVISRQFGDDDLYDRILGPLPVDTPIDEYAILWVDVTPELNEDGSLKVDATTGNEVTPHNYIVRRRAPSLKVSGCVMLAIDKVTVT